MGIDPDQMALGPLDLHLRPKLLVVLMKLNQLVQIQLGQLNHLLVLERDMKLDINMVPP
jgi:hypothetical protein